MKDDDPIREETSEVLADFRSALPFLTSIPGRIIGKGSERPDFSRAARIFPLVGALIGIAGGLIIIIGAAVGLPPLVVAALAVAAVVILSGGLHEDGLADTADGFGGGATAERKLEIMSDSRIGAFGAVALILSAILRVATLAALIPAGAGRAAAALIAAEAVSRAAMVRLWHDLPSARSDSMAEGTGPPDQQAMLVALIGALVIVALAIIPTLGFWAAFWGTVAATAAAFGFARLTAHQIGGRTGDTLGACQQGTLVAFLVGVAAFA